MFDKTIISVSKETIMHNRLAVLTLAGVAVAVLSGCGTAAATTTQPVVSKAATVQPVPVATMPAPTTAPPTVAPVSIPSCVALFTANSTSLLAATYVADKCTMSGSTMALAGSATTADGKFITYPNGVTVTLAKVQRMPNSAGASVDSSGVGLEPSYALVRVDLDVANAGKVAVSLGTLTTETAAFSVMYGNAVTAHSNPGIINMDNNRAVGAVHQDSPPAVVLPGNHVDLYRSFSVPVADLSSMSVGVDPDPTVGYTPYRITDLSKVMVPFQ